MIDISRLRDINLFEGLSIGELQSIANEGKVLELGRGKTLFEEDNTGRDLYILLDGKIRIEIAVPGGRSERAERIQEINPGEVLGEFSYVDEAPRSATARADRDSRLFFIAAESLDELIERNPSVGYHIMRNIAKTLCERIRNANLALRNALIWI
ncbi:MAG TPA: cyclic nucleotide-binding domain-containing protein [bacterium]|nr:cyclic nucleotide-binding domain-containing protein [bacterium]